MIVYLYIDPLYFPFRCLCLPACISWLATRIDESIFLAWFVSFVQLLRFLVVRSFKNSMSHVISNAVRWFALCYVPRYWLPLRIYLVDASSLWVCVHAFPVCCFSSLLPQSCFYLHTFFVLCLMPVVFRSISTLLVYGLISISMPWMLKQIWCFLDRSRLRQT